MKVAFDSGINFFDTAEAYSNGESEVLLGKAIKKYGWKRNDLVVATKVRNARDARGKRLISVLSPRIVRAVSPHRPTDLKHHPAYSSSRGTKRQK